MVCPASIIFWGSRLTCRAPFDRGGNLGILGFQLLPCPFTGSPKMFWAGPNVLSQTKNLFTYSYTKYDLENQNLTEFKFLLSCQFSKHFESRRWKLHNPTDITFVVEIQLRKPTSKQILPKCICKKVYFLSYAKGQLNSE